MNKREFLAASAAAVLPGAAPAATTAARGPALLTVTGAIGRGNRGPFDSALDQMMKKHGVRFARAHTFDFATLSLLPPMTIRPTLEYDGKPHTLAGPALIDVLKAAGAKPNDGVKLVLRAVDGYAVAVPLAEIRQYHFMVATHLDGKPMALGGLGPLWAVYHADRFPEMAAKPVGERFALCPWGLYHIEVQPA